MKRRASTGPSLPEKGMSHLHPLGPLHCFLQTRYTRGLILARTHTSLHRAQLPNSRTVRTERWLQSFLAGMRPPNLGTSIPAAPRDAPTLLARDMPVPSPTASAQTACPGFARPLARCLSIDSGGVGHHPRPASRGGGTLKLAAPPPPPLSLQQPGYLG